MNESPKRQRFDNQILNKTGSSYFENIYPINALICPRFAGRDKANILTKRRDKYHCINDVDCITN